MTTELKFVVGARIRPLELFVWLSRSHSMWVKRLSIASAPCGDRLLFKVTQLVNWLETVGRNYKNEEDHDEAAPKPKDMDETFAKVICSLQSRLQSSDFKPGYVQPWALYPLTADHAPSPAPADGPRWEEMPDFIVGQLAGIMHVWVGETVDPESKMPFPIKVFDGTETVERFRGLIAPCDVRVYVVS